MKNHNTSLLIILFNSYDWSLIWYSTIIRKISFFVIAPVYQRLSALVFFINIHSKCIYVLYLQHLFQYIIRGKMASIECFSMLSLVFC